MGAATRLAVLQNGVTHIERFRHLVPEDRIVPVAHAEKLESDLPVHIIDGVGHMPNAEAAEAFNRLVGTLLAAADARP